MAIGRPTKYKPEYCQELVEHMAKGFSFASFAADIDVNQDTLHEWAKVHDEFSDAKKRAFDKCLRFWEDLGVRAAQGLVQNFNAAAWIFNMKNRFRWTDRQDINTKMDVGGSFHKTLADVMAKIEDETDGCV